MFGGVRRRRLLLLVLIVGICVFCRCASGAERLEDLIARQLAAVGEQVGERPKSAH